MKNQIFSTILTNIRRNLPRSVPVKYDVNQTSGFREDFKQKFRANVEKKSLKIEKLIFQNHLNKLDKGPPKECFCKIWSQSEQWFEKKILKDKFDKHS